MHKVSLITGDGIGPEIVDSVKKIFKKARANVEFEEMEAGIEVYEREGDPLPKSVVDSIKKNKVALKGPITTPVGKGFKSVNVRLRKELNLYANLRPVKSFEGVESRYKNIDLVIVRENTEDLYAGIEHRIGDYACESIKLITRPACDRIIDFAVDYCNRLDRNRLTCVHKANIMKLSDGLFLDVFKEKTAVFKGNAADDKNEQKLKCDDLIVDACAMNLVINPEKYDTLVMPNLYGDIISDLCAGLVGGLGLVAGANIGGDYAVFEAVHGSAPDIAGKNQANPTAILMASIMMLEHLGEMETAKKIDNAIKEVLKRGEVRTPDLGGKSSTDEFTDAVCELL